MKRHKALLAAVAACVLMLGACGGVGAGGADEAPAGNEPSQASTTAQDVNPQEPASLAPGGELRLAISDFAANWNPLHVDGNRADYRQVREPLLPALFTYNAKGVPAPNPDFLVSAEATSQEPTVINYKLNPDAVWGDGSPVDGDDMLAVWKACNGKNKKFNCASTEQYSEIEDITMGSDKTDVTVTYASPFPDWSQAYGFDALVKAESVADEKTFNEGWSELKPEWLSGPFMIDSFNKTQKVMTLVPNDEWWGKKPVLDKVVWNGIAPDATAQAFANNEIDAFDIGSDPDAYQRATGVADAQVRKAGGPNFRHFTFNSKAGLIKDKTIRQAIVYGLDREAIGASDLAGIDWPVKPLNNHVFLESQEGFVDTAELTGLKYDPEKAKSTLEEAGWKAGGDGVRERDGEKLVVKFTQIATVQASENEGLQAQAQLKEVGIQLDIVTIPVDKFSSTLSGHEFEIIAFSWIGTQYPFSGIKQLYGTGSESNYAQLSMPEVDELAKQIAVETDKAKRIELANRADRIIWENVHTLPLYQRPELWATKSKLANFGAVGLSTRSWEKMGYMK